MTLTFSKPMQLSKPPAVAKVNSESEKGDCKRIESCKNFNSKYTNINPRSDIEANIVSSIVFKKETTVSDTIYEFWIKANARATYYTIFVSNKDKLLDSIRDEYDYSVPLSSFRINDDNELEIVFYEQCRAF